jgi:predicted DsbA family dithiol-disulfide isomerase
VANEAGLDKKEVLNILDSDLFVEDVKNDEIKASANGIHAVPFYVIDDKYGIPGALSYDDFKNILIQILEEKKVTQTSDADNCSDGTCRIN